MDEKQINKLSKQIKTLNVLLGFFAFLVIVSFVGVGFLSYQTYSIFNKVDQKINSVEQTLENPFDINL